MWTRSNPKPNPAEKDVAELRPHSPKKVVTPKDNERIEKILASIAIDTAQTFNALLASLMGERPVSHHASNQTRDSIDTMFDEIRQERKRDRESGVEGTQGTGSVELGGGRKH